MQFVRLLLPLLIVWPSVALADLRQTIRDYEIEIAALEAAHDEWLNRYPAQAALRQSFTEKGIDFSMMYVESWGDNIYLNWSAVRDIYTNAEYRLSDWKYTVGSGRFDEAVVEGMLAEGMQVLRHIDAEIDPWFLDDLKNSTERAYWLDRAHEVGCCDEPYYYYRDVAARAYADSISPNYLWVGRIQVFAPVPEDGGTFTDPRTQNFARLASQVEAAFSPEIATQFVMPLAAQQSCSATIPARTPESSETSSRCCTSGWALRMLRLPSFSGRQKL
jgi:hypothetical protein